MGICIGIDIHKAELTVAQHEGPAWTAARTPVGLARLATRLRALGPTVIVLEPSGGYERAVMDALRQYIHGIGVHAKSDRLDARMLALFGARAASPSLGSVVTVRFPGS